jgi:hypothetical protein
MMSIPLYHFKELNQCIKEVERIETKVKNSRSIDEGRKKGE